jgi:hypothetical protein
LAAPLQRLYPEHVRDLAAWERAFEAIRAAEPAPNDDGIAVVIRRLSDEQESWWDVAGRAGESGELYALDFSAFSQWAGYAVDPGVVASFPVEEAAAHILWEATFYGFTDEEIAAARREFEEAGREPPEELVAVDDPRLKPFCDFLAAKRLCPVPVQVFVHWDCDVVEDPESGEKGFGAYVRGGDLPEIHVAGLAFAGDEDGGIVAVAEIIAHEYAHHVQTWYGEKPDEEAATRLAEGWRRELFGQVDSDPDRDD